MRLSRSSGQKLIFTNLRFKAAAVAMRNGLTPELQAHLIKMGLTNKNVV